MTVLLTESSFLLVITEFKGLQLQVSCLGGNLEREKTISPLVSEN